MPTVGEVKKRAEALLAKFEAIHACSVGPLEERLVAHDALLMEWRRVRAELVAAIDRQYASLAKFREAWAIGTETLADGRTDLTTRFLDTMEQGLVTA